jgi:hypothetical protein
MYRDRVRERDLDNFLVEELHASPDFLRWIVAKLAPALDPPAGAVAIQKSPPREQDRRQTDLRIGWFDEQGEMTGCVLIESKVTADFQQGQAQAYATELAALRGRLGARHATAMLVAPRSKLPALRHDGAFDAELAIEDMIAFMEHRRGHALPRELDVRLEAQIELLGALCGKRSGAGWLGATIPEKRDFAQSYAELAAELLPNLRVRPSTDGPKAITRIFEGLDLPDLPRCTLRHEFGSGAAWKYANVLLAGAGEHISTLKASGVLDGSGYTAEPAGKSLALRVRTPGVDPMRPFEEERDAVAGGLKAMDGLVRWMTENRGLLAELVGKPADTTTMQG